MRSGSPRTRLSLAVRPWPLLLLGCAAQQPLCLDGSRKPIDGDCPLLDSGTTSNDSATTDPPHWSVEAVEATVPALLSLGLPDGVTLDARYQAWMAQGDLSCPCPDCDEGSESAWSTDCTTEGGTRFLGDQMSFSVDSLEEAEALSVDTLLACGWEQAPVSAADGPDFRLRSQRSSWRMTDADGATFNAGGFFSWAQSAPEGADRTVLGAICGTFVDQTTDGWLGAGVDVALWAFATRAGEDLSLELEGGLAIEGQGLDFRFISFAPEACGSQPSGSLGIRDTTGTWATLSFDEGCDGCGPLVEGGEELGRACVDLSGLPAALLAQGLP